MIFPGGSEYVRVSYAAIFSLLGFSGVYMSVVAIPAVVFVVLVSMASGAISSSFIFSQGTGLADHAEKNRGTENVNSLIIQEDDELSRLTNNGSQSNAQKPEADENRDKMQAALADMSMRIDILETANSDLKSRLGSMLSKYQEISGRYSELEAATAATLKNNSQLAQELAYYEGRSALLTDSATLLENKLAESISPPYTFIKDREIYWVFKDYQGNRHTWNMSIDTYRAIIEKPEPQGKKFLHSEHGVVYSVRDHTKFVDSSSFSHWADDVFERVNFNDGMNQTSRNSQFVYEVWYIISQLTAYSPDIDEDPRWPLETLVEGGGDCEDFAVLVASILRASPHTKDWQIQLVYFDSDHPDQPENVNHVSLFIKTDEFETYVDRSLDPSKNESWEYINGWYFDV